MMKRDWLIILGLIAITVAAFAAVGNCGFINFDDPAYVYTNPHVTEGLSVSNVKWAFTTFYQGNYLPFTWLSLMLDATLFPVPKGAALASGAATFHCINLGFHIANVVLLYLFFRQATGAVWRSALIASVFAVHPLRVESVAWVVERKDVLTGFFALLTMLAYLRYARRFQWRWYAATVLLFMACLLAKQVLATLPCVLLLLDYWPLGRWDKGPAALAESDRPRRCWTRLIIEKLPLLFLAVVILTATFEAQSSQAMSDLQSLPMSNRLSNAIVSYVRYLGKMVWFGNLAILYPHHSWTTIQVTGASALLVTITLVCLWNIRRRPWLSVGWFWFLGVLVPMIGIVQFGPQAMADRFTYFAGIGLLIMLAWSMPASVSRWPTMVGATAAMTLAVLMFFTFRQTFFWHDSVTLFNHDIQVAGSSYIAELNLGVAYYERGKYSEAISHLRTAGINHAPTAKLQAALATALAADGQIDQAIAHARAAVRLEPHNQVWTTLQNRIVSQKNNPQPTEQFHATLQNGGEDKESK
jgi:tetratricopeptide (TPR) repeat protein